MKKMLAILLLYSASISVATPMVYPASWFDGDIKRAKSGGTLRTATINDFKTFNPFLAVQTVSVPNQLSAGARLFMIDPVSEKYIPMMAESMPEISNGGKRFIVKIRKGMRFSDGRPITANDWVTTYKIHSDKEVGSTSLRGLFMGGDVIRVKKLNNYTLQFDFPKVSAVAYRKMSLSPWPHHIFGPAYDKGGAKAVKALWDINTPLHEVVAPGAWIIKNYISGQRIIFSKNKYFGQWNKDYTGRSLPHLNFISTKIIGNQDVILSAYLAGDLDIYNPRHSDDLAQIKKTIDEGKINVILLSNISPSDSTKWITFNWNRGEDKFKQRLFRSVNFRRAMSHLANREAMIQLALGGSGTPIYSSVYPVYKSYLFKSTPKFRYNIEAAKSMLGSLGFKKKNEDDYLVDTYNRVLEFDLMTDQGNVVNERLARIFADEAKKAGVKVNVVTRSKNVVVENLISEGENRKWDAILLNISGGADTTFPYEGSQMSCGAILHPYNRLGEGKCLSWAEQRIASLFKKGEQTLDDEERKRIGEEISKLAAEQQAMIYLAGPNAHVSYNSRIGGWYKKDYINAINGPTVYGNIMNYFK